MQILQTLTTAATLALMPTLAAAQEHIIVASTTSTEQSGLFDHILPIFEAESGIEVRVVAQGTGQALETGRRGDADVVFVHARDMEAAFVAEGYGVERFDGRCCRMIAVRDSHRESMGLDGRHEQAQTRPLPHHQLV